MDFFSGIDTFWGIFQGILYFFEGASNLYHTFGDFWDYLQQWGGTWFYYLRKVVGFILAFLGMGDLDIDF